MYLAYILVVVQDLLQKRNLLYDFPAKIDILHVVK